MLKIIVNGANGRMGSTIIRLAESDAGLSVTGKVDTTTDPLEKVIATADVVIDFSSAAATTHLLETAMRAGKPVVMGTTGHTEEQKKLFKEASTKIALLVSPNMSVGVNLVLKLTEMMAKTLGKDYKVEITERHHVHKKDAPSGTAKKMMETYAKNSGININDIHVESVREGEIVGDHIMVLSNEAEKIELAHFAQTREIFAKGALRAAKWIAGKPAGLYDMQNVLF